jgi:hypothetical protein
MMRVIIGLMITAAVGCFIAACTLSARQSVTFEPRRSAQIAPVAPVTGRARLCETTLGGKAVPVGNGSTVCIDRMNGRTKAVIGAR